MLIWPQSLRVFLCCEPRNLRCSFDRLAARAGRIFAQDPLAGHLFVFCNRPRDRVKILFWDRSGLCLFYKRLEPIRRPAPLGPEITLLTTLK